MPPLVLVCVSLWLTFQCHSAVFRELIGVEENSGLPVQRVLNIEHILVLEAFIVRVEIPRDENRKITSKQAFF